MTTNQHGRSDSESATLDDVEAMVAAAKVKAKLGPAYVTKVDHAITLARGRRAGRIVMRALSRSRVRRRRT